MKRHHLTCLQIRCLISMPSCLPSSVTTTGCWRSGCLRRIASKAWVVTAFQCLPSPQAPIHPSSPMCPRFQVLPRTIIRASSSPTTGEHRLHRATFLLCHRRRSNSSTPATTPATTGGRPWLGRRPRLMRLRRSNSFRGATAGSGIQPVPLSMRHPTCPRSLQRRSKPKLGKYSLVFRSRSRLSHQHRRIRIRPSTSARRSRTTRFRPDPAPHLTPRHRPTPIQTSSSRRPCSITGSPW